MRGFGKPNPGASAVFIDELDAGKFQGAWNDIQRCAPWLTCTALWLMDSDGSDPSMTGQVPFAPAHRSPSAASGRRDQDATLSEQLGGLKEKPPRAALSVAVDGKIRRRGKPTCFCGDNLGSPTSQSQRSSLPTLIFRVRVQH